LTPLAAVTLALTVSCTSLPPEGQLVADSAQALGGRDAVANVKTLRIEGGGTAYMLGQNQFPDSDPPTYKVTDFVRTVDLQTGRVATQQTRTAQFAFAGNLVSKTDARLDGSVAFNVTTNGAVRASERDARDRRLEMLHHPVAAVRAALDTSAKLTNLRQEGEDDLVDVTTAQGDVVTLAVNRATKLPSRVSNRASQPNLGDVVIATRFESYQNAGGLKMPTVLTTTIDTFPQSTVTVTAQEANASGPNMADMAASDEVKAATPPVPPAQVVTAEPVAKGIWWLAGSGNHRSVVFEFDDHLVLYEVPVSEERSKAVIDKARTLSPKPLTHAIVSHHHFDHSGGLRAAVAEGLTVITQRLNEPFFKALVARPHTLEPDALAKAPRDLKMELVDDTLTLKDKSMDVRLYHLLDNEREGTNLYAYVPRDRMLVHADLYDNTWLRHLWGQNVLTNIAQRSLKVDVHVPVHGARESFADMVKTIKAKPS
jgi:hypothetical protein